MTGLYIHIPFCASRCVYCGFYSTTLNELKGQYVEALCHEMELRPCADTIATVYLGGGTPSQLSVPQLQTIFYYINKVYRLSPDAEITMECNPDDIHEPWMAQLPVNRISLGAQTFSDERLQWLHRRHRSADVERAVNICREAGIENISVDLMFGFPNETLQNWLSDLRHVIDLNVEHISAYSLMYEEGTPLKRMLDSGSIKEIDEELSLKMYDMLIDTLTQAGYEHYEISNFAKPGRRSRHNSSYWRDVPYIGLGAAAHSYDGNVRQWNVAEVKQYIASIQADHIPCEREEIDADTHYDDIVTTALRTREGIDLSSVDEEHRLYLLSQAQRHIAEGLLQISDGHLHLTRKGLYISDSIMSDLMDV